MFTDGLQKATGIRLNSEVKLAGHSDPPPTELLERLLDASDDVQFATAMRFSFGPLAALGVFGGAITAFARKAELIHGWDRTAIGHKRSLYVNALRECSVTRPQ